MRGFWQSGIGNATDGLNRRVESHGKVGLLVRADSHLDGEVAVGAKRLDIESAEVRAIGSAVGVDEREKQLRAGVSGGFGLLALLFGEHARNAISGVEGL